MVFTFVIKVQHVCIFCKQQVLFAMSDVKFYRPKEEILTSNVIKSLNICFNKYTNYIRYVLKYETKGSIALISSPLHFYEQP